MSCLFLMDGDEFYSGGEVRGRLKCTFEKSEKIRGIKIRASGEERTHWTDYEDHYDEGRKQTIKLAYACTGFNNIFNFDIMLYGGNGETFIGPGVFEYPFTFHLPPNLPSSYVNEYGYIRFSVKGIVDIPWGIDYEATRPFEVVSPIDLNTFPMECFAPISRSENKTVCCWCCASGDISLDININKTAFIPGEKLYLFMTLTNMSNSNVETLAAKLVKYIKTKVTNPRKDFKENRYELSQSTHIGVGAHGENKYEMYVIIPPRALYPNLNPSTLYEISYEVEICAKITGCHSNIDLSFNIEVGHIQHQSQLNIPSPTEAASGSAYPAVTNSPYSGESKTGATSPPEYQSVCPDGPPKSTINSKEREAAGQPVPSAPSNSNDLPPSYEDASKNEEM